MLKKLTSDRTSQGSQHVLDFGRRASRQVKQPTNATEVRPASRTNKTAPTITIDVDGSSRATADGLAVWLTNHHLHQGPAVWHGSRSEHVKGEPWRWVEAVALEVRLAQGSSGLLQGLGGPRRKMSQVDGVSCGPADMVYVEATHCSPACVFSVQNFALGREWTFCTWLRGRVGTMMSAMASDRCRRMQQAGQSMGRELLSAQCRRRQAVGGMVVRVSLNNLLPAEYYRASDKEGLRFYHWKHTTR